jgi:hypothetical protein
MRNPLRRLTHRLTADERRALDAELARIDRDIDANPWTGDLPPVPARWDGAVSLFDAAPGRPPLQVTFGGTETFDVDGDTYRPVPQVVGDLRAAVDRARTTQTHGLTMVGCTFEDGTPIPDVINGRRATPDEVQAWRARTTDTITPDPLDVWARDILNRHEEDIAYQQGAAMRDPEGAEAWEWLDTEDALVAARRYLEHADDPATGARLAALVLAGYAGTPREAIA